MIAFLLVSMLVLKGGVCGIPLEPGETHAFGAVAVSKCNRHFRHACRHWCSHGLASEFCRACHSPNGPCGLHPSTESECKCLQEQE